MIMANDEKGARMHQALTMGELATSCGVNRETIRFYERNGLLNPPTRSESGYRLFDADAAQRVRFIKRAQSAGFTLDEIRALLEIKVSPHGTSGAVRAMVDEKIATIEARIRDLQAMHASLLNLVAECPGGDVPVCECPVIAGFDAQRSLQEN
jgi:DNA-binding transcriptional MerR regulator